MQSYSSQTLSAGASIPSEAMMHFPPVSDFPLFSKNFWTFWKISQIFPFPEKISHFHPPKFRPQISDFPPYFACFTTFPPDSRKFLISPLFKKFSPCFQKNSTAFYILYVYFSPLL